MSGPVINDVMQTSAFHHQAMRRTIRNLTAGVALAIAAVVAGQSIFAENIPAATDPGTQGEWGAPFDVGLTAIHSSLLQSGKVLFWGDHLGSTDGSLATLWDPSGGALFDVSMPYKRNIFCAGEIHLADGRLMVIGGM